MGSTFVEYRKVYEMLEDEESRDIYLNKLNWLISGDRKYFDSIVTAYLPGVPLSRETAITDIKGSMPKDRKIVLYGAGTMGRKILHSFSNDERFVGFCSKTKEKQRCGYCGWPVISPEELLTRKDMSVVISASHSCEEIKQILQEGGYPQNQIYSLEENYYEDPGQYFAPDFMKYENEETLIDVGCYDLNSILQMMKYCKYLKKVYAFEPDPTSYKICQEKRERFHLEDKVELLPFGVWSKRAELHFNATNDGLSHLCDAGEITVPVMTIDEMLAERNYQEKITLIKMDVEGSELEALKGAKETIQRDKPKLTICIYHKPEDMTEIPLYIKKLVPEYKLYVRHHTNSSAETVLYTVFPQ